MPKTTDTLPSHGATPSTIKIHVEDVALGYVLKKTHEFFPVSKHLEFSVTEGEFVAVVGRSGCGKSTLLYAFQGLVPIDEGHLTVDGTEMTAPRRKHAMVFQDSSLFPWRSVWKNIIYGLDVQSRDTPEALEHARRLISIVGLDGFENSLPHELSGGMRQRVNLARALATDPTLLLLDEPFAALDAQTRQQMQFELARIWQETEAMSAKPKTAVFITHDIAEAVFVADRVVIMSNRPSKVKEIVDINLPRPRKAELKESADFATYVNYIAALLAEESNEAEAGKAAASSITADVNVTGSKTSRNVRPEDLRQHRKQQLKNTGLAILGWCLMLGLWEISSRTGIVNPMFSSSPSGWTTALFHLVQGQELWVDIYATTKTMMIGFLLSVAIGVPCGVLFAWSHVADKMTSSIVAALYALPYVAFVPLIVLWFGINDTARIALITWSALFPMLINTTSGVRNLNRQFLRVAQAYCAPQAKTIATVVIPAALPYVLTGVRLAIGRALVAAVVAEFFMSSGGLGYFINNSAATFNMDNAFAGLVVIGILGVTLVSVTSMLERRFSSWVSAE